MKPLERAQMAYNHIADDIKEDVGAAIEWAKKELTEHEGGGHLFNILPDGDGVICCLAKPEWAGDHCSQPMESGEQAIVMAVCEYLNGV